MTLVLSLFLMMQSCRPRNMFLFTTVTLVHLTGLLVGRGKKSQISRDFQGQIRGENGRFRGNFAGIFEASFAEKRLVKNGRFRKSFPGKFCWKATGFELIWGKLSMKLDALIAFTQASNRNMKSWNTFTILIASSSIFFIQMHVVCLTFEILFTTILHYFNIWGTLLSIIVWFSSQ